MSRTAWRETHSLHLERGPYHIVAGLDESLPEAPKILRGRFVNLFDPELRVRREVVVAPGSRWFLRDLERSIPEEPAVIASACKTLAVRSTSTAAAWTVEGVGGTPAVVLIVSSRPPKRVSLAGDAVQDWRWDDVERLLWIRFPNTASPRELEVGF